MLLSSSNVPMIALILLSLLCVGRCTKSHGAATSSTQSRPNIMFILIDDIGFSDASIRGGQFATPNLDSLLSNSLILDRHYIHLLCSPSRTQFLTGRYAMSFGFGALNPWDATEIGGIPVGQPTIANWLSQFGSYTTYAVGKWHVGYATPLQTPTGGKGFTHFYGFYQGAIAYVTKKYLDIESGDSGIYDFWEDGEPVYDVISSDKNTMELYSHQIETYLSQESTTDTPFYMYAALQAMHVPFPSLEKHHDRCKALVDSTDYVLPGDLDNMDFNTKYAVTAKFIKYCGLLSLLDDTVGRIMDALRAYPHLYDNTLVVLTSDNGGEIVYGANNFPLRGSKGEMFDGNIRVLTALSGGVIEKHNQGALIGQHRSQLISNLDWTPTLLRFAGYLDDIDKQFISWDGVDQYDMIMHDAHNVRNEIILNIGDRDLNSASVIVTDSRNGKLYKYMMSSPDCITDRWMYSPSTLRSGSRSVWDANSGRRGYDTSDDAASKMVDGRFYLFDLSDDEGEFFNLMSADVEGYSERLNERVVDQCMSVLSEFLKQDKLFSMVMSGLHDRLEVGDPTKIGDGKFVRPFLDTEQYLEIVEKMIDNDVAVNGRVHTEEQRKLYLEPWVCPAKEKRVSVKVLAMLASGSSSSGIVLDGFMDVWKGSTLFMGSEVLVVLSVVCFVLLGAVYHYGCCYKREQRGDYVAIK